MQKTCSKCNTALSETALFCPACGEKVTAEAPKPAPIEASQKGKNKTVLFIAIGVMVVFAILAAFFLTQGGFSGTSSKATPAPTPRTVPIVTATAPATATPAAVSTNVESAVESIRTRYYAVQANMATYKTESHDGATFYYSPTDHSLVRVDVDTVQGGDSYYYDRGALYFVFSYTQLSEDRLYFEDNQLIRWLHRKGEAEETYEGATSHPSYTMYQNDFLSKSASHHAEARYRVRKSYGDAQTQIGAYGDLENAKRAADGRKQEGYKVYTMYGELIYTP